MGQHIGVRGGGAGALVVGMRRGRRVAMVALAFVACGNSGSSTIPSGSAAGATGDAADRSADPGSAGSDGTVVSHRIRPRIRAYAYIPELIGTKPSLKKLPEGTPLSKETMGTQFQNSPEQKSRGSGLRARAG